MVVVVIVIAVLVVVERSDPPGSRVLYGLAVALLAAWAAVGVVWLVRLRLRLL
jgi:hypothetical protein